MLNLSDFLPDAICIVDSLGNIKQSNISYKKRFISSPSELKCLHVNAANSVNFVNDILHLKHQNRFFEALKILLSDNFVGDVSSVSLRYCMSYLKGTQKSCKETKLLFISQIFEKSGIILPDDTAFIKA